MFCRALGWMMAGMSGNGLLRLCLSSLFLTSTVAFGQHSATLRGRAVDTTGQPLKNAVVRLITDMSSGEESRTWRYRILVDEQGNFNQDGIAPGSYVALLFADGKGVAISEHVVLHAGDARVMNFGSESATVTRKSLKHSAALAVR